MSTQSTRDVRQPVAVIAIVTAVVLAILALGATLPARAQPTALAEPSTLTELPNEVRPGHDLPAQARCTYPPYGSLFIGCRILISDHVYFITYHLKRRIITRTSIAIDGETIGQLILAWGLPTGIRRAGWMSEVHWGDRSVYVGARTFSPTSRTAFISFDLEPGQTAPWTGFTNRDG